MNKIKVLIVDDHGILRESVGALLRNCDDITVIAEASDGAEAIVKSRELDPDVILMDIAMPGMDGFEAIRRIKRQSPNMRILILTQHTNRDYILSGLKAGADGYVPKAALSSELISAIRAACQGDSFLHPKAAKALIENYRMNTDEEPFDQLTDREKEILKLLVDGHSYKEISGMLFISQRVILGYRTKIMEKLDLHNHLELLKYAARKGLIDTDN